MDTIKYFRRIVRGADGQLLELENQVQAKEILHAGDLPTGDIDAAGVAMLVGTDGRLLRSTMGDVLQWLQGHIQGDLALNIPYVNTETGRWMVYDPAAAAYQDSGIAATGPVGPTGETGAAGKTLRTARVVIGRADAGWTEADCDILSSEIDDDIYDILADFPPSGGEIVLLDGTYVTDGGIILDKPNVTIRGVGDVQILGHKRILTVSANNCKVENIGFLWRLDGDESTTKPLAVIENCSGFTMRGCRVLDDLFLEPNIDIKNCSDSVFCENNFFTSYCRFSGCSRIYFAGNRMVGDTGGLSLAETSDKNIIIGNCIGMGYCIQIQGGSKNLIVGNVLYADYCTVDIRAGCAQNVVVANFLSCSDGAAPADAGTGSIIANNTV